MRGAALSLDGDQVEGSRDRRSNTVGRDLADGSYRLKWIDWRWTCSADPMESDHGNRGSMNHDCHSAEYSARLSHTKCCVHLLNRGALRSDMER